jgi:predicted secreted protein
MSLTGAIAIYFVLWWLVLFAVLPWGIRSQHESGNVEPGTDPGAPLRPLLLRKAIATTVVSALIFPAGLAAWESWLVTLDSLPSPFVSSRILMRCTRVSLSIWPPAENVCERSRLADCAA